MARSAPAPFDQRLLRGSLCVASFATFVIWAAAIKPDLFFRLVPIPPQVQLLPQLQPQPQVQPEPKARPAAPLAVNASLEMPKLDLPVPAVAQPPTPAPPVMMSEPDRLIREIASVGGGALPTYLVAAVGKGLEPRMDHLLQNGVDVNSTDAGGRSALLVAAGKGYLPLVRKLLAAGANPNLADAEGRTPLMAALAAEGETTLRVMTELLDRGAGINAVDAAGFTALRYAIIVGDAEATELLLARGADSSLLSADGKSMVAQAFESHDPRIAAAVLSAQQGPLEWDNCTREALFTAVRMQDRAMLRLLLSKHASPPTLGPDRQPLLAYTIGWNDPAQLELLLECGANPNITVSTSPEKEFAGLFAGRMLQHYLATEPGMTPLMIAAGMGRSDLVQILLKHGAKTGAATGKHRLIALYFASWSESASTVLALMGRDPRLENHDTRVEISLSDQRAYFYKKGAVAMTTRVSTGRPGYPTPTGQYVVTDKHATHRSTIYKVPMPYFMRLSCREFGLHQGIVPNYPASHGCIRVPAGRAYELFKQVEVGTLVTIVR